jgi:hypothetical protein
MAAATFSTGQPDVLETRQRITPRMRKARPA